MTACAALRSMMRRVCMVFCFFTLAARALMRRDVVCCKTYSCAPRRIDAARRHVSPAFILSAVTAKYYSEWDENKTGSFLRAEWIEVGSLQQQQHAGCYSSCQHAGCYMQQHAGCYMLAAISHVICAHLAMAYLRPVCPSACRRASVHQTLFT